MPNGVKTIALAIGEYLADMLLKQKVLDTQRELTRWDKHFLDAMGNLKIAAIQPKHVYEYIHKILPEIPSHDPTKR